MCNFEDLLQITKWDYQTFWESETYGSIDTCAQTQAFQLHIQDFVPISNTYFEVYGKGKHVSFSILITVQIRKKRGHWLTLQMFMPCAF